MIINRKVFDDLIKSDQALIILSNMTFNCLEIFEHSIVQLLIRIVTLFKIATAETPGQRLVFDFIPIVNIIHL